MQLSNCGAIGGHSGSHAAVYGHAPALTQIARRAGGDDVFPGSAAAPAAGNDMIKRQIMLGAAVLANEPVPQK